jgi:O-antigen ligase
MKSNTQKLAIPDSGVLWVIIGGAALITLYFNSKIQDPFNSPKFWLILIVASWLLGHRVVNFKKDIKIIKYKTSMILILVFITASLISLVMTRPIYIGLFGENMRRNGFLSYLALSILFISCVIHFSFAFVKRLNLTALFVGLILSIYSLMQISGIDFIKWNNPYNKIIATVGNPNFAAAIMAVIAVINFGAAFNSLNKFHIKLMHIATSVLLLVAIAMSDARQGLISIALGVGLICIMAIHARNKKLGYFTFTIASFVGVISILGMLQIGPLAQFLYKGSVTVRGYYWSTGIKMLTENPLFGVGLDRYGAYFKEYRSPLYSKTFGFDITSNNAHNVPIQLFATGGILVGLSYLVLLFYIGYRAFVGIRKFNGNRRMILVTFLSAWLAFQAQSIVSIDNLGISVWGWILGGVIIALSFSDSSEESSIRKNLAKRPNQIKIAQPLISGSITLAAIVLISFLYKGETLMYQARVNYNPQDQSTKNTLLTYNLKINSNPLIDSAYKVTSATYLSAYGLNDKAIEDLKKVLSSDPRNLDALNPLAEINERFGNVSEAIKYREIILNLDPWNARNLLMLGREYQYIKDYSNMLIMKEKINAFDPNGKEAASANTELIEQ